MPELVPGLYERLVTAQLDLALAALDPELTQRESLDPADAHVVLARHIGDLAQRALRSIGGGTDDRDRLVRQVALANAVVDAIAAAAPDAQLGEELVAESRDLLRAVVERTGTAGPIRFPSRPETPLAASALLVNGRDQPRIGSEVQRELPSADRVDLLCAFIKWHGLRVLEQPLEELLRRGGRREIERGFPVLPAGCHIELDRVVTDLVLANVRRALNFPWIGLVSELREIGDCSLGAFLDETGLDLEDIYRRRKGGWAGLRRPAGFDECPAGPDNRPASRGHADGEG